MAEQPIIVKKIKAHGHAHHGGSWKVAYADFVTAMMAFFMVMWIMGLSDETRAQIQGYFNDPVGFMKNTPRSRSVIPINGSPKTKPKTDKGPSEGQIETARSMAQQEKEAEEIRKEVSHAAESGGEADADLQGILKDVEMSVTDEGLKIEFIEREGEVFFELGSAVIRPAARKLIAKIAPVLARSGKPMLIDGHTDARAFPSHSYDNWNLSGDRANALRRALCENGVSEKQLLGVRAHGATQPRKPEDPFHFSNRRVAILLPFKPAEASVGPLPAEQVHEGTQAAFPQAHE